MENQRNQLKKGETNYRRGGGGGEFTLGGDREERRSALDEVNSLGREKRERRCSTNGFHFRRERREKESLDLERRENSDFFLFYLSLAA